MKQSVYIMLAVMLLTALGCGRGVDARLERADALMNDHPDSALAIVSAIDTAELRCERDRAEYGLLLTQARHKCDYIDTDDSLISAAARYFDDHGPDRRKMLARFYHAQVLENAGNRSAALARALPVIDLATDLGDTYWLARTHELIGDLYYESYNIENAVYYYRQAAGLFSNIGHKLSEAYSMLTVARAVGFNGDNNYAIGLLDSIKIHGQLTDSVALGFLEESYVRPYVAMKQLEHALATHQKGLEFLGEDNYYLIDWIDIGLIYLERGQMDSVQYCYDMAQSYNADPYRIHSFNYSLYNKNKDFKRALLEFQIADSIRSSEYKNAAKQDITLVERTYSINRVSEINAIVYKRQIITFIVVLVILLCMFVGYVNYKRLLKKKKHSIDCYVREIQELIAQINERDKQLASLTDLEQAYAKLQTSLEDKELDVSLLGKTIADLEKRLSNLDVELMRSIFYDNLEVIDCLCTQYVEAQERGESGLKYGNKLEKEIKKINSSATMLQLEDRLNCLNSNIVHRMETELKLKDSDIRLAVLLMAGLSPKTICLLLGIKIDVYYNRTSRLKAAIRKSDHPDKDIFLNFLKK